MTGVRGYLFLLDASITLTIKLILYEIPCGLTLHDLLEKNRELLDLVKKDGEA